MDPRMAQLLKWGVENSDRTGSGSQPESGQAAPLSKNQAPNTEALNALFGGPSDAELMKAAMSHILSPTTPLSYKLLAFDDFEQLVENIDNANNLTPLNLWEPLIEQLRHEEADMRKMAAWCLGTAVQNNAVAQERAMAQNAVPVLVEMALAEIDPGARRKALYALSSVVRNYQPALDAMTKKLPPEILDRSDSVPVDAGDMEVVDGIFERLRKMPRTLVGETNQNQGTRA